MSDPTIGDRIVAEAETWKSTPYCWGKRDKYEGADCLNIYAACLIELGIANRFPKQVMGFDTIESLENAKFDVLNSTVDFFLSNWLNSGYKKWKAEKPIRENLKVGDLVLVKTNRRLSYSDHGLIVVNTSRSRPMVLHYLNVLDRVKLTKSFISIHWKIVGHYRIIENV